MKAVQLQSPSVRSRSEARTRKRMWQRLGEHRAFLVALCLAGLLRVVVQLAFPPAFVFSDGPTYLALVDSFVPSPDRTVGYGVLLSALAGLTRDVAAVAVVQHLMGLLTAVLIYALLIRREVRPGLATLASLPVLFDGMQLVLEHSVLSDVLFQLLVVAAIVVLAWRRVPRAPAAALGGLLLGVAVLVRVAGGPMVLAGVLFCVLAGTTLRARAVTSIALILAFALPLVGYASWYHHENGSFALTQASGRALYMRTTAFVDCSRIQVPSYQRALCPTEPLGERRDPTYYGWHDPDEFHGLQPPDGSTPDEAMQQFGRAAIREQPFDYARVVLRDVASAFAPVRADYFEYETYFKWNFASYVGYEPTGWTRPAYAAHGGEQPSTRQPWAGFVATYGSVVYLWGPLLLALLVVVTYGLVARRRVGAGTRPLIILLGVLGVGLALVPDLTAQFTWRYQLPMVVLVPVAAALTWTRLRDDSNDDGGDTNAAHSGQEVAQSGTAATPSTD